MAALATQCRAGVLAHHPRRGCGCSREKYRRVGEYTHPTRCTISECTRLRRRGRRPTQRWKQASQRNTYFDHPSTMSQGPLLWPRVRRSPRMRVRHIAWRSNGLVEPFPPTNTAAGDLVCPSRSFPQSYHNAAVSLCRMPLESPPDSHLDRLCRTARYRESCRGRRG